MKLLLCLYLLERERSGIVRDLYATAVSVLSVTWVNGRFQDCQMNIFPSAVRAEGERRKCPKASGRKLLILGVYRFEVVKCDVGF